MDIGENKDLIDVLSSGGVAVIPTDTIYGIVGSALNPDTVERIFDIKNRSKEKPLIVLLANKDQAKEALGLALELTLEQVRPTTFVVPFINEKFKYLTRGKNSLAIRIPAQKALRDLISKTGPLVAPSANPEGQEPAKNIAGAKKYFAEKVDFYLDGGEIEGQVSKIIEIGEDGAETILRE